LEYVIAIARGQEFSGCEWQKIVSIGSGEFFVVVALLP
jgi:hypothetical protein